LTSPSWLRRGHTTTGHSKWGTIGEDGHTARNTRTTLTIDQPDAVF